MLPDSFTNYLSRGSRLPALALNQFHKAYVFDVKEIAGNYIDASIRATTRIPVDSIRNSYYLGLQGGDSGNPLFVFLSGEAVLLTVWTAPEGAGTAVSLMKQDINQMMDSLGGGYHLTEINLSGFRSLE